ncbi:hypothetical protein MUO71_07000 [Candidatus Bathyarchaeota archaeon]|nr:hypothetical protein [Candidatus Bathyarchaeota archaeon]
MQWNRTYGGAGSDVANSVVQTSDGGYALAGRTSFFGDNTYYNYCWLVKTDSEGNMEWNVTCVYGWPSIASSMIQTSDGGYAVSGYTSSLGNYLGMYSYIHLVKVDFNGTKQWVRNYDGLGDNHALFVVETDDGGYAVAGTTQSPDEGAHYEIWFTKADTSGESIPEFPLWTPLLGM